MIPNASLINIVNVVLLVSVLVNVVLGSLVVFDSPRRRINRLFGSLCLLLTLWGISFLGYNLSPGEGASKIWSRIYIACVLFIAPLFFNLSLGSLGNAFKGQRADISSLADRIKQLAYVFSSGWLILSLSGVFPLSVKKAGALSFPLVGGQFWAVAVFYLVMCGLSLGLLLHQAQQAQDPTQKSRLLYLSVGTTTVWVGGLFNFFLITPPSFSLGWLVATGHFVSSASLLFIAYALTTSQMYHFSEMVRKSIAFLTMTLILILVFGGTHVVSQKIFVPVLPDADVFAVAVASILMALLFHPLRYRVQNLVDQVFFSKRYDQMNRLRGLSRRVLSSADRDELLNILFTSLKDIGFSSVSLLLKDPQKPLFHIKKGMGLSQSAEGFFLKSDSLLIQYLREEKNELIRDEVTRRILADWERQTLSDEMGVLQSEIAFPLFSTRRRALFGVITLGNSELGYSSYKGRNIFWLKSLIDNAGIMLDNFYHQEFANALVPYVGRSWADEMRRNKEGFRERLAGHRTWVSVVMVDIRHFTNMSAKMDPVEVVSLLKDFRSRVAPVVYRHQGTIDKFIGDAIMIVFGLPILPHLTNPDKNAVECAYSIAREIEEMNRARAQVKKDNVSVGIGVSSGEVIAGNVDSGDRVEYTVIGDAANMVARLEDLAGDDVILISPATHDRVKDHVQTVAWAPRCITGFDDPITVYELKGIGAPSHQIAANQ